MSITEDKIRKSLLSQLSERGLEKYDHYISLVDDYVALWNMKNKLLEDIEERGVSIPWQNGANQSGYKRNDSVPELNKTNGQMLKLLSELGLRGSDVKTEEEEVEL